METRCDISGILLIISRSEVILLKEGIEQKL